MSIWTLHGDGRTVRPDDVVRPEERLAWPYTIGIGLQHVVAMFGATFLVPVLTGFPPSTTIFFSGIGTLLFLLLTRNRLPSYLGSSFAFIAPVLAAKSDGGIPEALGGIVAAGVLLALVGLLVQAVGSSRVIPSSMPRPARRTGTTSGSGFASRQPVAGATGVVTSNGSVRICRVPSYARRVTSSSVSRRKVGESVRSSRRVVSLWATRGWSTTRVRTRGR